MTQHSRVAAAPAGARMVSVEAVILRAKPCPECGYGEKYDAAKCRECGADMTGVESAQEPQGIVSYWHKNPLRRWAWRLGRGEFDTALAIAGVSLATAATVVVVHRLRRRR